MIQALHSRFLYTIPISFCLQLLFQQFYQWHSTHTLVWKLHHLAPICQSIAQDVHSYTPVTYIYTHKVHKFNVIWIKNEHINNSILKQTAQEKHSAITRNQFQKSINKYSDPGRHFWLKCFSFTHVFYHYSQSFSRVIVSWIKAGIKSGACITPMSRPG